MVPIRLISVMVIEKIQALFPNTYGLPRVEYEPCENKVWRPVNIGVVLSGGQAPGGHNVIAGIFDFVKKVGGNMYGFRYGPRGVFTGKYVKIDDQFMDKYRNMGGFDMIGSGRDKIKGDEQVWFCEKEPFYCISFAYLLAFILSPHL